MGLEEPEVLVGFARDSSEEISGIGIPDAVGSLDRGACLRSVVRGRRRQAIDMREPFSNVLGIGLQRASPGDLSDRAGGTAAERGDALCDGVDLLLDDLGDLVE